MFTEAEFRFEPIGANTRCVKKISYECPIASTFVCHHEVMNQQHAVMSNLQKHFSPPVMATKSMWQRMINREGAWFLAAYTLLQSKNFYIDYMNYCTSVLCSMSSCIMIISLYAFCQWFWKCSCCYCLVWSGCQNWQLRLQFFYCTSWMKPSYAIGINMILHFTFMLPCIVIDLFLNNEPDAPIIQIYSVIKL